MISNHYRYPRPEGALTLADIKKGLVIYHVYGYPNAPGEIDDVKIVLNGPIPYGETQDAKSHFKKKQRDKDPFFEKLTIITCYQNSLGSKSLSRVMFADDVSLIEISHNNNYIFSDLDLAQKYADYVKLKRYN